uniref:Meg domain-containing protein n=1 Tax=Oryza brachyantha TaxID=4533 RepID=J3LB26_ORYBR
MEMKRMQHVDARLLFLLLLLIIGCFAVVVPAVQCRSNGEMLRGEKINRLPGPLCAKHTYPYPCKNCWCCMVSDGVCYKTLEDCQDNCPSPPSSLV